MGQATNLPPFTDLYHNHSLPATKPACHVPVPVTGPLQEVSCGNLAEYPARWGHFTDETFSAPRIYVTSRSVVAKLGLGCGPLGLPYPNPCTPGAYLRRAHPEGQWDPSPATVSASRLEPQLLGRRCPAPGMTNAEPAASSAPAPGD